MVFFPPLPPKRALTPRWGLHPHDTITSQGPTSKHHLIGGRSQHMNLGDTSVLTTHWAGPVPGVPCWPALASLCELCQPLPDTSPPPAHTPARLGPLNPRPAPWLYLLWPGSARTGIQWAVGPQHESSQSSETSRQDTGHVDHVPVPLATAMLSSPTPERQVLLPPLHR